MMIRKVLIANRGEIALRIIRTLTQMNISSVAMYTAIEAHDLHVKQADEAYPLGNGTLADTWLNIPLIIKIARQSGAQAIHPGYGFLSENAAFARACEQAGIIFIGPSSETIEKMGSKITASRYAQKAGIPLLPRMEGGPAELLRNGPSLGFPLLVKAASGGGGKGMIRINSASMLHQAVFSAAEQAKRYFNDDTVYLEKYLQSPRHIEVQVLADQHGNIVHLFERECTLQRNHQKVIEEAPSASLSPSTRDALHTAAVKLAREVGYTNAGTIEFIVDEKQNFYFLEMNTRIQVEHPVTEQITGIDLVKEQLLVAMGEPLSFNQQQVKATGHAIEARLYAEDPGHQFRPSPGTIQKLIFPRSGCVRIDSAIVNEGKVHATFDAMIAKIITYAPNRTRAIEEMDAALNNVLVHGITTNINLLSNIIRDDIFRLNDINTHSITDHLEKWSLKPEKESSRIITAAIFIWLERYCQQKGNGAWRLAAHDKLSINNKPMDVFHYPFGSHGITIEAMGESFQLSNIFQEGNKISFLLNNNPGSVVVSYSSRNAIFLVDGVHYHVVLPQAITLPKVTNGNVRYADIKASLYGKVLRVNVTEKQKVKSGDSLLVIESMKMENAILAPADHIISSINVKEGDQVSDGQVLICFEQ
jgi:3-methylcrotonyl-CoA carboxylase alpha subunit